MKAREAAVERLINKGTEIFAGASSSAVSAAVGFLLAGPEGAFVGGAVGTTVSTALKKVGYELSQRVLSPREEARVGYVFSLAAEEIIRRIENNENIRTDGFFDEGDVGRSESQEVWESVLMKSQREPEERKLRYMAYMLANFAFDPEIGSLLAHQITKAAEQLTYRQMCILRLTVVKDRYNLRTEDYRGQGEFGRSLYQVLYEYLDLYYRGFVNFGGGVAFGPTDVKPGSGTVQGLGTDLYNLMQLWMIPVEDILPIAGQMK